MDTDRNYLMFSYLAQDSCHQIGEQLSTLTCDKFRPVRFYKPYFFSQRTIFFSHTKSANSTFSHASSAKQAQTNKATFEQWTTSIGVKECNMAAWGLSMRP